jgi:hypothetical protein
MENKIIIEMTPFIFEDGKIYYFEIRSRLTNKYHNLFCFKKVKKTKAKTFLFFKIGEMEYDEYEQIGSCQLIDSNCLNKENIESEICQLIRSHSIKSRDSKIDDLLG